MSAPNDTPAVQSEFRHLGQARRGRGYRLDWDGDIIPKALKIISEGRSYRTAAKWLKVDAARMWDVLNGPSWSQHYMRACVERAASYAEKSLVTVERDDLAPDDKRVRVDTYKWFAARMDPKRWAERQSPVDEDAATAKALQALGQDTLRQALWRLALSAGGPAPGPVVATQEQPVQALDSPQ